MNRQGFLDLAASGLRMPIGTDLVLRARPDAEGILLDAGRLAEVIREAADTYGTPLAVPPMDLAAEKAALLEMMGIQAPDAGAYHFAVLPTREQRERFEGAAGGSVTGDGGGSIALARLAADAGAVALIAREGRLVPTGMTIGPFSLMTKLLSDPIVAVYSAGEGVTAAEDEDVALVEGLLELSRKVVAWKVGGLLAAGARAIFVAEPAASAAFVSPKQLARDGSAWERFVMAGLRELAAQVRAGGAELLFHCCGDLCGAMVSGFASLDPALLSLGSSRALWEDARLVGERTVLYGNLPTKRFHSDGDLGVEEVRRMAGELSARMRETGHPFILGSECDVLSVPGCEETIRRKVRAMIGRE